MASPTHKSLWIAGGFALAIAAWIGSGFLKEPPTPEAKSVLEQKNDKTVHVQVTQIQAIDHPKVIRLFGETSPNRELTIKAETAGQIATLLVKKGDRVAQDTPLARLHMDNREDRRQSAQALLRQRELEYEAAVKLSEKSFRSQTSLAQARAQLSQAQAELKAALLDITHTQITAPFNGRLEDNHVEVGDYLKVDAPAFHLIDLDPIVITAFVAEQDIMDVRPNQKAEITLGPEKTLAGTIRFIAKTAEANTRTYRIEFEAPNPGSLIPAGQTAHIVIPITQQKAVKISPALLSLSDRGEIGVKTVNANNIVEFHSIQLLEDTFDGLWIKGLPDTTHLITRGQEYVIAGQRVLTSEKEAP